MGPAGRVHALDISPAMVELLRREVAVLDAAGERLQVAVRYSLGRA